MGAAIETWEEQERRHKERQGVEFPEKTRIAVLFQLAPKKVSEELLKQTTNPTSKLKRRRRRLSNKTEKSFASSAETESESLYASQQKEVEGVAVKETVR